VDAAIPAMMGDSKLVGLRWMMIGKGGVLFRVVAEEKKRRSESRWISQVRTQ
jgi:hypothetical protein